MDRTHLDHASQDINLNSPNKGQLSAGMSDVPVTDGAVAAERPMPPVGLTESEEEELKHELLKVEEEISTLRQVLSAKERHASEIKQKLGLTTLNELKQNLTKGWQDVQKSTAYVKTTDKLGEWNDKVTQSELYLSASSSLDGLSEKISQSEAYKKTQETLSQAGQKTSAALTSVGSAISKTLGGMSSYSIRHSISMPVMRNSTTFKSFEDTVENLKVKVIGGKETESGELHSPGETENTPSQDKAPF
ncbi:tumor protein D54 isoform X2 [Protopterus annectens]|uniref:tumor protein D54 isoform X2 n=1 Tax=Protopterus annectens TaxID=7888 RepID=UPI001CFA464A|nr:tumor protein D54 isoform X2 [Protopterus annectens]